ncbi:MAG: class I SAM-dependent methyltransferase [Candidatus Omnitrophica bacterium]|nr:class I SAM-dependent methyltransferase [Candidatus Omnitrophota bacterium]
MKVERTHDLKIYLNEDRRDRPKECFKFIAREAHQFIKKIKNPKIVDVGCATGEFLYYLSKIYPQGQFTGIDIVPQLIKRAKNNVRDAKFLIGDIYTGRGLPNNKFDVVFCTGVASIFDNYKPFLDNLLKICNKDGRIYIFTFFNPEDVDVLVKVRYSGEKGAWQAGWNIFSKKTIGNYLDAKGLFYIFKDWKINIDLPKSKVDSLRSRTLKLKDGTRLVTIGAQLMLHFYLLEIRSRRKWLVR